MNSSTRASSTQAAVEIPSNSDAFERAQEPGFARHIAGDAGMSDTMRTIVWITGVAFGVLLPGAYAQGAVDPDDAQKIRVLQMPITDNHDTGRPNIAPINRGNE